MMSTSEIEKAKNERHWTRECALNWRGLLVFAVFSSLPIAGTAQAQSPGYFSGIYGGIEGGTVSFNTQITFDGVDDPAGRGSIIYGAFLGYNQIYEPFLVGTELVFNLVSHPDPYTFDPSAVGFSEMDVRRGASVGVDVRGGYLAIERILLYGTAGFSYNSQSVRIDDVPLEQFDGGSGAKKFGALQLGVGLEVAVHLQIHLRASVRTLQGRDLSAADFGTIPTDASLSRFDVEPSQLQFLFGVAFRL